MVTTIILACFFRANSVGNEFLHRRDDVRPGIKFDASVALMGHRDTGIPDIDRADGKVRHIDVDGSRGCRFIRAFYPLRSTGRVAARRRYQRHW